MIVLKGFGLP